MDAYADGLGVVVSCDVEQPNGGFRHEGDKDGRQAALLRHWRALPEPLQEKVSDLAETLVNLYLRTGKD